MGLRAYTYYTSTPLFASTKIIKYRQKERYEKNSEKFYKNKQV